MECQNCKLSSSIESLFIETKKGILLCPACDYGRNSTQGWVTLGWVSLFLIIGHTLAALNSDKFFQYYLLGAAWWMLFLYLSLAAHEFGHFLLCRALGGICPLVTVGEGRVFFQLKTKTSLWKFSTNPSLGIAYAVFPESKSEVWREVLMLLGGVFINSILALIGILIFLYGSGLPLIGHWYWLFSVLAAVNLLLIFCALFSSMKHKGLESDGHAVYRLLRHGRETDFSKNQKLMYQSIVSHALLARGEYQELSELILARSDYKEMTLSLIELSVCYAHTCRPFDFLQAATDAFELFQTKTAESLPKGAVEEVVSAMAMNNLAFALYSTRSSDKDRILELARDAYELMPWEHSIKGTYGAALIYSDSDVMQGITLLEEIIRNPVQANDQMVSINYYCLAEGYEKLNEVKKVEEALRRANYLNADVENYFVSKQLNECGQIHINS